MPRPHANHCWMLPVLIFDPEFLTTAAVWSIATLFNQSMTLVVRSSSFSMVLGLSGKSFGVIAGSGGTALFNAARRPVGSR